LYIGEDWKPIKKGISNANHTNSAAFFAKINIKPAKNPAKMAKITINTSL
jgi:hypothetical protein